MDSFRFFGQTCKGASTSGTGVQDPKTQHQLLTLASLLRTMKSDAVIKTTCHKEGYDR